MRRVVNFLRVVFTVWRKELLDAARDRRSLITALLVPLLIPLLVAGLLTRTLQDEAETGSLELWVAGKQNAPGLVARLEQSRIIVREAPPHAEDKVRDGELIAVLIIPQDYAEKYQAGHTAQLTLLSDESRTKDRSKVRRIRHALALMGQEIGLLRLLDRGVSPELVSAIAIEDKDVATPRMRAARLLTVFPLFVLLSVFIGGMNVAVDVTAGERERGSLEPLLINPVSTLALVCGKWLSALSLATLGLCVTGFAAVIALNRMPLYEVGLELQLGPREACWMLLTIWPLAPFATALEILVSSFAQSFKEAQTYLSFLMLTPVLPGMVLTFYPLVSQLWLMPVPILSQQLLLSDLLGGTPRPALWGGLAALLPIGLALGFVYATSLLLKRESIVLGR